MNSNVLKTLLLALTLIFGHAFSGEPATAQAQDGDFNIEMELPEGSAEFGSEDFTINTE